MPDDIEFNPGGLTAIWAEENSRSSLFRSLKRKEVYATSGPRISLRVFASSSSMTCEENIDFGSLYTDAGAVPMGGTLNMTPVESSPTTINILAVAQKDPGVDSASVDLAQIQVIKTWVDSGGISHEQVYDVAGQSYKSEKTKVAETCTAPAGVSSLCTAWSDPSFNADQFASYYVRVLEVPKCRWSTLQCKAAKVQCAEGIIPDGYEACCGSTVETVVQERAWSSPIWVRPDRSETSVQ